MAVISIQSKVVAFFLSLLFIHLSNAIPQPKINARLAELFGGEVLRAPGNKNSFTRLEEVQVHQLTRDFTTSELPGTYIPAKERSGCPSTIVFSDSFTNSSSFPASGIAVDGNQCEGSSTLVVGSIKKIQSNLKPGSFDANVAAATDALVILNQNDITCGTTKYGRGLSLGIFDEQEITIGEAKLPAGLKVLIYREVGSSASCPANIYVEKSTVPDNGSNPDAGSTPGAVSTDSDSDGSNSTSPESTNPGSTISGSGGDGSSGSSGGGSTSGQSSNTGTSENGGNKKCFPASSMIELEGGEVRRIDELKIGDRVKVGPNTFSEVFLFTHRDPVYTGEFVQIATKGGQKLSLTRGHYLYVNGELAPARSVEKGDVLLSENGLQEVVDVKPVNDQGLFNPQTLHGDIVVNGFVTSTFTEAVTPKLARTLLKPFQAMYNVGAISESWAAGMFKCGTKSLLSLDVDRMC